MANLSQSYSVRIVKNSLWASLNFLVTSLVGFFISIILTRYFGKENYGIYSYFIWFTTISGIVSGFGLNHTITKYLPRYFFRENIKYKAYALFKTLLKIQLVLAMAVAGLMFMFLNPLKSIVNFNGDLAKIIIIIASLNIIPATINNFCASTISTLQQFKKLGFIQMLTSVVNLAAIITLVIWKHTIPAFFWLFLILNFFITLNFIIGVTQLFKTRHKFQEKPVKFPVKNMIFYSFWNCISVYFEQIVWERSEIFFLALFSNVSQIAVYSIAYSLVILLVNFFVPVNTVLNYTTAEIIAPDKNDKLKYISQNTTKYLAILMLPALIYAATFIGDIVDFVYGQNFKQVALIFPLLAISHVIGIIVSPAENVPNLKNEAHKITFILMATAVLNLALDFYLIPRYEALGAAIANTLAQFFSITLILFNAKKYKLGLLNRHLVRILAINAAMGSIMLFVSNQYLLPMKIVSILFLSFIYSILIIKFAFNRDDVNLFQNLEALIPKLFHPIYRFLLKKIAANAHSD